MSSRILYKKAYKIFEVLESLENSKKRQPAVADQAGIQEAFDLLEKALKDCLSDVNLPEARKLLRTFDNYRRYITENLKTSKRAKSRYLVILKQVRTKLFRKIKKTPEYVEDYCYGDNLHRAKMKFISILG